MPLSITWDKCPGGEVIFRQVRSIMETPILDERKWVKVPSIPADYYIVDLEDSVVPARKLDARERVLEYLRDPAYFHHRPVIARPNNLATPWGRDDIIALASVGATLLAYPKVKSAAEIETVAALVRDSGGAQPFSLSSNRQGVSWPWPRLPHDRTSLGSLPGSGISVSMPGSPFGAGWKEREVLLTLSPRRASCVSAIS
jgi:HpcH/HpaI aldolase/citrate lyase family